MTVETIDTFTQKAVKAAASVLASTDMLPTSMGTVSAIIEKELRKQDRDTRHACAEAVIALETVAVGDGNVLLIDKGKAHSACMNARMSK